MTKQLRDKISILTIGNELLDGRVVDSNTSFIANVLAEYGLEISERLSVVDSIPEIQRALDYLFEKNRIVIISGGLGPTSDDLTREALAEYFSAPLEFKEELALELKEKFLFRKRPFDPLNLKQAWLPKNATAIKNPLGTAPGFNLSSSDRLRTAICLPGVPRELKAMFTESCLELIKKTIPFVDKKKALYFKTFGVSESAIGSAITSLNLPESISVSYRATFPEVHLGVWKNDTSSIVDLKNLQEEIRRALDNISSGKACVFSEEKDGSLVKTVHSILINKSLTISVAESCTAGLIGKLLTDNPGSSKYFLGGVIAYDNEVKIKELNIPKALIEKYGAVSHECVKLMAQNCRMKFHSSIAISVSGVAGPATEGSNPNIAGSEKPVGTFFIGISSETGTTSYKFFFSSTRDLIRTYAGFKALDLVRRLVNDLPVEDLERVSDAFGV